MIDVTGDLMRAGLAAGDVRTDATAEDAIDEVTPELVVSPRSAAHAAATLKWASEASRTTVIRGGGSKLDWGRRPRSIGLALDMRRLNALVSHAHGDLVATIQAGARLADVNRALAAHAQCLPIDPSFADVATIGGILATNDSGPSRHRYGTPRDLVLGIELATTEGVVAKSGGQVVKNVAGYDLARLMAGSHGSLAAVTAATFKLAPLPAASATCEVSGGLDLLDALPVLVQRQLEPTACEVIATLDEAYGQRPRAWRIELLIRFATHPAAVSSQVTAAHELLAEDASAREILTGDAEVARWNAHTRAPWVSNATIVRVSWLPANLRGILTRIADGLAGTGDHANVRLIGRAAVGAGLVTIGGDVDTQVHVVEHLRASPQVGHVVVLRAPSPVRARVDAWGSLGDRAALLDAVKRALDPNHILNAGRGPVG